MRLLGEQVFPAGTQFDGVRLGGLSGVDRDLRRADGSTFPENSVDPEDIRVDPMRSGLHWTSEGDRIPEAGVLINPDTFVSGFHDCPQGSEA